LKRSAITVGQTELFSTWKITIVCEKICTVKALVLSSNRKY